MLLYYSTVMGRGSLVLVVGHQGFAWLGGFIKSFLDFVKRAWGVWRFLGFGDLAKRGVLGGSRAGGRGGKKCAFWFWASTGLSEGV